MTSIKTYPIHATYDTGLQIQQDITIVVSDTLYAKCVEGFEYTVTGQSGLTNLGSLANTYLGENAFSKNIKYYHGKTTNPESVEQSIAAAEANGVTLKIADLGSFHEVNPYYEAVTALTNNNQPLNRMYLGGSGENYTIYGANVPSSPLSASSFSGFECTTRFPNYYVGMRVMVVPSDFFNSDGSFNTEKYPHNTSTLALIGAWTIGYNISTHEFTGYVVRSQMDTPQRFYSIFPLNFKTTPYNSTDTDLSNPYGADGSSTTGGGDGTLGGGGLDSVDPTEVPDLPDVSAAASGFITLYNPTSSNLKDLYSFLWSNTFDLNTFKKLYTDPMDCIISLGILPCLPATSGARDIMFGNVNSEVNCTTLGSQFAKVQCGSVNIEKYVGSFMDYSPYVKIHLFLPFIGFVNLGTDDLMGGSISITYHVDVLSGDCIAFISHSVKGVLYTYNGNCRAEIPLTAQNNTGILRNYYESVAGIIPSTVNGAMSGGAAGAALGAGAGALNAASNIVLNSKPTYQRSGSLAGSAGLMGVQTPFIVIERPNISVPNNVEHYAGQTSNITMFLGTCSGYTVCEYVHLEGIAATTEEIAEMETLLNQGVYL